MFNTLQVLIANFRRLSYLQLLLICAAITIAYVIVTSYFYNERDFTPPFNARKIDMALDSSRFWDERAQSHGFKVLPNLSSAHAPISLTSSNANSQDPFQRTCQNFFALWPSDCVDRNEELHDKMAVLSAQMVVMNATLTLYTTAEKMCTFNYPNIKLVVFNATQLLIDKGFSPAFEKMSKWNKSRFTRISDILRICLAHENKMSYLDTDVHFLQLQAKVYEQSYVGAAIWGNAKNAIEITNAAFCLPSDILSDMMSFQLQRILHGSDNYFYTELGPSMFHNVLLNRRPVTLYSQNHPAIPSLDRIASDIHLFAHKQLHLTGHVRKGNSKMSFGQLVNEIRRKSGLPTLSFPPSGFGS